MSSLADRWSRIDRWLAEHAPRTRKSLLPPVPEDHLRAIVARHDRRAPAELYALYALAGGQRVDPRGTDSGARGLFDGYWFMPVDGVDGVERALEQMPSGALFPFAKDFGGAYLCFEAPEDEDDPARVVEIGADDEPRVVAGDLGYFLYRAALRFEEGDVVLDERIEERTRHVVLFDACRPRNIGDPARHSVFDALAVTAIVEDLDQLFGTFDDKPAQVFGLAVRLTSTREFEVEDVALVDPNDRPLRANTGRQSGGGRPGRLVYVWDRRPLPSGARLRVTLASIQRG